MMFFLLSLFCFAEKVVVNIPDGIPPGSKILVFDDIGQVYYSGFFERTPQKQSPTISGTAPDPVTDFTNQNMPVVIVDEQTRLAPSQIVQVEVFGSEARCGFCRNAKALSEANFQNQLKFYDIYPSDGDKTNLDKSRNVLQMVKFPTYSTIPIISFIYKLENRFVRVFFSGGFEQLDNFLLSSRFTNI